MHPNAYKLSLVRMKKGNLQTVLLSEELKIIFSLTQKLSIIMTQSRWRNTRMIVEKESK